MGKDACPKCREPFRMAYIGNDPPEPYGEVCGCPDDDYNLAREEKRANDEPFWAALANKAEGEG